MKQKASKRAVFGLRPVCRRSALAGRAKNDSKVCIWNNEEIQSESIDKTSKLLISTSKKIGLIIIKTTTSIRVCKGHLIVTSQEIGVFQEQKNLQKAFLAILEAKSAALKISNFRHFPAQNVGSWKFKILSIIELRQELPDARTNDDFVMKGWIRFKSICFCPHLIFTHKAGFPDSNLYK